MRKLLIGIGVLLIVGAVIWKVGVAPGMEKRLSSNWQYELNLLAFALIPAMLKNSGTKPVENIQGKTVTSEVKTGL
jgi:hypothetical protein